MRDRLALRSRTCGLALFVKDPDLVQLADRPLSAVRWSGVLQCRNRVCPVCHIARRLEILREVGYVANERARETRQLPLLATLTIRHSAADPVAICKLVRVAWRKVISGRQWMDFRANCGGLEWIAAEEITYGANGYHPHMHIALLPAEKMENGIHDYETAIALWSLWFRDRWAETVESVLGKEHRPSEEHGALLTRPPADNATAAYVAKIAYELTDAARGKSIDADDPRAPRRGLSSLDLLMSGDLDRYLELCHARYRARDLTWSTGLRPLRSKYDELPVPENQVIASVRGSDFQRIKGQRGEDALRSLIEASASQVVPLLNSMGVRPISHEEADAGEV